MTTTTTAINQALHGTSTRRKVTHKLMAMAAMSLACPRLALSATEAATSASSSGSLPGNPVQFTWAVRSGEREASRTVALRQSSAVVAPQHQAFQPPPEEADDYGDPAFAPMILIVGAAAISIIADVIIRLRRDMVGGIVVDARTNSIDVRENPKIPGGMVIVIGPDKSVVKFEPSTQLDVAGLVAAFTKVGKKVP